MQFVEIVQIWASEAASVDVVSNRSKLKLILSYLRASSGQDCLRDLAPLKFEREKLETTGFDTVIDQFATVKSRK